MQPSQRTLKKYKKIRGKGQERENTTEEGRKKGHVV